MVGDDDEDTALLRQMSDEATEYISSFSWCETIVATYFGGGVGGVFAIFFYKIRPARAEVDPWIWVIVGDIPPAYLPISDCRSAAEAFKRYMCGMSKWVELARNGQAGSAEQGVPPVNVPATPEWAEELERRLQILTLIIKPLFEPDSKTIN
jgi:hypothetical protein